MWLFWKSRRASIANRTQLFLILGLLAIVLHLLRYILDYQLQLQIRDSLNTEQRAQMLKEVQIALDARQMWKQILRVHRIDASGEYYLLPQFASANFPSHLPINHQNISKSVLALAVHCSLARLHYIQQLAKTFTGSVSLALFVQPEKLAELVYILSALRTCNVHVRERVSFHVVLPLTSHRLVDLIKSYNQTIIGCDELQMKLSVFNERAYEYKYPYPNNLLRNLARTHVTSSYVAVLDIDIVPSSELYERFSTLSTRLARQESHVLYVLPTYEVDVKRISSLPRNKFQLLEALNKGIARPFYAQLCPRCHQYTDYDRWQALETDSKNHLNVAYEVTWKDPWEPFYIARNNPALPVFDERFRQYGFNRISQSCELHVAGYRFYVLDQAFLLHQGFKKPGEFHQSKDVELERNRALFRQFKDELKRKYPFSTNRCY